MFKGVVFRVVQPVRSNSINNSNRIATGRREVWYWSGVKLLRELGEGAGRSWPDHAEAREGAREIQENSSPTGQSFLLEKGAYPHDVLFHFDFSLRVVTSCRF